MVARPCEHVVVPLPPLPEVIPFPVYGLADDFSGLRWMVMWNYPSHFSTISLGHGHPDDGAWTVVTTVTEVSAAKSSHDGEIPPPLIAEAAAEAALSMVDGFWELIDDVAVVQITEGQANLVGWDQIHASVDGAIRIAWTRSWANSSAIVIDLPPVAISILRHGTTTGPPPAVAIATDRLADYAPLAEPERRINECDDDGLEDALDRLERIPAVQSMDIDRDGPLARVHIGVITELNNALTNRIRGAIGRFPFSLEIVRPNVIAHGSDIRD
jgi:hypothetical protein